MNKDNWDILRSDENTRHFGIQDNKQCYIDYCKTRIDLRRRAGVIIDLLIKHGFLKKGGQLCSLGCGMGVLEWHLKDMYPDLKVCCSDYTSEALGKLSKVLDVDEFLEFDMSKDNFNRMSSYDCLMMNRVSTEFDFDEWRGIFNKTYVGGCNNICFIPDEFATSEDEKREVENHKRCIEKGEKDMFCGWLYSEDEFEKMFLNCYQIKWLERIDNTGIYLLKRK